FRGPLTIANAYLHGLIDHVDGDVRHACAEVATELQNLQKMVDNVMLSLQIEAQHHLALDVEEFDLVSAIQAQSRRMQHTTDGHTISVQSQVPELRITADRLKVQTVVVNLLGNAIKYTPTGGRIDVEIRRDEQWAEVTVTDHGIGLGERDAETLFERYGRGESALDLGIAGHGLGLFICRQIVEAHGGRIYARSGEDGTRFIFRLPFAATTE